MDNEPIESLWVRTKEMKGMGDGIVVVSYRPPDQKEQLEAASHLQAMVLNICWRDKTAGHKQFRNMETLCKHADMPLGKPKALLELNQARDFKGNKNGFCKYMGEKKKAGKTWAPCSMGQGHW